MNKSNPASSHNKMGIMPIFPLIMNMSLPMMAAMLVQSLYNIVDSVFVSMISEDALTAVSLAFPVQNLMISFAVGSAIGVCTMMSTRLGEGKQQSVDRYAMQGIFLALVTSVIFAIAGVLFLKPYLSSQTPDQNIQKLGLDYMMIVTVAGFGCFLGIMGDRLLQATGRTHLSMIAQMAGAIINIVLDPILIFGVGIFPKMGVAGAAAATVVGQIISMVISLALNVKYNSDVHLKLSGVAPVPHAIVNIYKIAVPSILLSSITSVVIYFMNIILGFFSSTAIAVYGVYFKLQSFVFMPVFGLNNGIIPIAAFNYGARNKDRLIKTIKYAVAIAFAIMAVGTAIFEIFPQPLLKIFNASSDMMSMGVHCLRRIAISFCGAAVAISFSSIFQALNRAFYSALVSFLRQAVILLPAAYLLSRTGDVNNVWWSLPIAEVMSLLVSSIMMRRLYRKHIKPL